MDHSNHAWYMRLLSVRVLCRAMGEALPVTVVYHEEDAPLVLPLAESGRIVIHGLLSTLAA